METKQQTLIEQGLNALTQYQLTNLSNTIDSVIADAQTKGQLHFKGTAEEFKRTLLRGGEVIFQGPKGIILFANKNPHYAKLADLFTEYLIENYEKVNQGITQFEQESGLKLDTIGFTPKFYNETVEALKTQGLFGKPGAVNLILDRIMRNLDTITDTLSKPKNQRPLEELSGIELLEEMMRRKSVSFNRRTTPDLEQITEFSKDKLHMSIKEIQQAYLTGGFVGENGVFKYLKDKIFIEGSLQLDELLIDLKRQGIEHDLTGQKLSQAYKQKGLLGKDGFIDKLAVTALAIPDAEKYLQGTIIYLAAQRKVNQLKNELKKSLPLGVLTPQVKQQIDKQVMGTIYVMIMGKTPDVMAKEKIDSVYKEHGLFGNEGLFGYLGQNMGSILSPALSSGMVEEQDISKAKRFVEKLSKANSFKELLDGETLTPYRSLALKIAETAHLVGVSPLEILSKQEHKEVKDAAIKEAYQGGMVEGEQFKSFELAIPYIDKALIKLREEDLDLAELKRSVAKARPTGFLGKVYDAIASKIVKKTITERLEDYLVLSRGLIERNAQLGFNPKTSYRLHN